MFKIVRYIIFQNKEINTTHKHVPITGFLKRLMCMICTVQYAIFYLYCRSCTLKAKFWAFGEEKRFEKYQLIIIVL